MTGGGWAGSQVSRPGTRVPAAGAALFGQRQAIGQQRMVRAVMPDDLDRLGARAASRHGGQGLQPRKMRDGIRLRREFEFHPG